jgi:8-oxo-dGTP pyrophosphatase MutT (NUDIX family)
MTDFEKLIARLGERLTQPLPGPKAHDAMRAVPSGSLIPKFEHKLPPKPGSVMILIYPDVQGVLKFPLIKRPDYLGTHSGQISLPGGKAEPGETFVETALREAEEEVGVRSSDIVVLGSLSNFFVIPSNFMVTPVVAYALREPLFVPDAIEVSRILTGNVMDLLPDAAIKKKEILAAGRFTMLAPHFEIEGEVVWGATAMMLNELRVVLNELIKESW